MSLLLPIAETLSRTTEGTGYVIERDTFVGCCGFSIDISEPLNRVLGVFLDVTETDTIPLLLVFGQRVSIDFKSPTGPICAPAGKTAAMFLRMTEVNSHKYLYKNTQLMGSEPLPDQLKTALSFVDYTVLSRFLLSKLVT